MYKLDPNLVITVLANGLAPKGAICRPFVGTLLTTKLDVHLKKILMASNEFEFILTDKMILFKVADEI